MKYFLTVFAGILLVGLALPAHELAADCEWEWSYPRPQGKNLNSIWEFTSSDIYAAGNYGTILHFDGVSWSVMSSGTIVDLHDIWGNSPSDIYVAGSDSVYGSTVLHFDGTDWSSMSVPVCHSLTGIWGFSSTDIFAVGSVTHTTEDGQILHYNGTTWSVMVHDATNGYFRDVWGSSHSEVFAVGSIYEPSVLEYVGTAYHFDGTIWTRSFIEGARGINYGVWGTSGTDVFVGGWLLYANVKHYEGFTWTYLDTFRDHELVENFWGFGFNDVYATTTHSIDVSRKKGIFHYDGITWTQIKDNDPFSYPGIHGLSSSDLYIAGEYGDIVHYNGTSWSSMVRTLDLPKTRYDELYDVWGTSPENMYFVGQNGIFLHYNGSEYSVIPCPTASRNDYLTGIWGTAPSYIYLASNERYRSFAQVMQYSGSTWTEIFYETDVLLYDIWGTSSTDMFAAGEKSGIGALYHYNGSTWTDKYYAPVASRFKSIWGLSPSDVYAAGFGEGMFHFDGVSWTTMPVQPSSHYLNCVWGTAWDNIYTVSSHEIFRYDGTTWTVDKYSSFPNFQNIWGPSPTNIFAVGGDIWGGGMYHYDGVSWSLMINDDDVEVDLNNVGGTGIDNVFVVGDLATILHIPCPGPPVPFMRPYLMYAILALVVAVLLVFRKRGRQVPAAHQ